MQQIAINWTNFGFGMGCAFVFGLVYAALVRWISRRGLKGQTAWSVVIGVSATLLAMLSVFRIETIAIMFCFFIASGSPMIVEYLLRVQAEMQQDEKNARELAKDLLNDTQTGDR
jgi:hypothetical protein